MEKEGLHIMAEQVNIFLRDNPDLKKVSGDNEEEVLMWAHRNKYIKLRKFAGEYWYTDLQYETAVMWSEKVRGVNYEAPENN